MIPNPLLETHDPVNSLTLEMAEFVRKRFRWKEGTRQFLGRYSWDSTGRLTSIEENDETRLYAYDDFDRETACYRIGKDGTVIERELKQWDDSSRLLSRVIRRTASSSEETFSYEHEESGRMIAERQGNRVRVKKHDSNGRIEQEYIYDGDQPDLVSDYDYSDDGRLLSEIIKDPDGRIHRRTTWSYDEKGWPTSLIVRDSENRILQDESYAYGASLGDMWLERVTWIPDGSSREKRTPQEVVYRSFTFDSERPEMSGEAEGKIPAERSVAFANGVYTGPVIDGSPEGEGLFRYNDESVYKGDFRKGVMSGDGRLTWPDGRQMEGNFIGGLLEGRGTCIWVDESRYEGEFRNGRMHGAGIFTWSDGTRFEGLFEKGQRTDQGAWEKK